MGERERGEAAARTQIAYFCSRGHRTAPMFAAEAPIPDQWECPRCGLPAGRDEENPPEASTTAPFKTHLAYVRERRSDADAYVLLREALAKIRGL